MAAGWVDYLRKVLGWPSSFNPAIGPYRIAAAQMFCTGAVEGEMFNTGAVEGETFNTGIAAGQVDGRIN